MKKNLDQIVLEPSAFSIKTVLRKPITYLTAIALGLLSCGEGQGTQIVPPSSSTNQYCQTDYNCLGESMVCENNKCVYSVQTYPQDPQSVYDTMVKDLESGNIEKVVTTYFDPAVQQKYRTALSQQNLPSLAQKLKDKILFLNEDGQRFREYEVLIDGRSYPVQMLNVEENGTNVWKIRGL